MKSLLSSLAVFVSVLSLFLTLYFNYWSPPELGLTLGPGFWKFEEVETSIGKVQGLVLIVPITLSNLGARPAFVEEIEGYFKTPKGEKIAFAPKFYLKFDEFLKNLPQKVPLTRSSESPFSPVVVAGRGQLTKTLVMLSKGRVYTSDMLEEGEYRLTVGAKQRERPMGFVEETQIFDARGEIFPRLRGGSAVQPPVRLAGSSEGGKYMDPWQTIQTALDQFYKLVWPMATALAGVGIATMALLQMVKDIFHLHRSFNRRQVNQWLDEQARLAAAIAQDVDAERARQSLVRLATAGEEDAFYSLETPQLTGQIGAASQVVLDYPGLYRDVYLCLAAQARREDVLRLLEVPPQPAPPGADEAAKAQAREAMTPWVDARNRVSHQIQRTLDGLQIAIAYRWKYQNQVASLVLNFFFVLGALVFNTYRAARIPTDTLFVYVVVATLGGFIAPVAKDLVTALQQLKARAR